MLVEISTGVQLDVALSGDESADPLLMVCGTSMSYPGWGPLAEALAERFRLIRYDHRGMGSSERGRGSIWMATLAADAAALLDALQVQRAHVLGWSLGSAVAQELALAHPDRVGALVLWGTWAATDVYQHALMTALRYPWATGDVTTAITAGGITFSPEFLNSPESGPTLRRLRPVLPQTKGQIRTTVQQWDADLAHDTTDRLSNIAAPTLVVAGEQDVLTPPRLGQAVAALIPGARWSCSPARFQPRSRARTCRRVHPACDRLFLSSRINTHITMTSHGNRPGAGEQMTEDLGFVERARRWPAYERDHATDISIAVKHHSHHQPPNRLGTVTHHPKPKRHP